MQRTVRVRIGWSAALAAAIAAGCGDLGFVADVVNRRPFTPPAIYLEWWTATEACSARSAPFRRVVWFLADGVTGDGLLARGRWSEPHDIIIVAGYENDPDVVKHEMLHDLVGGDRGHERAEWDRCGLRVAQVPPATGAARLALNP